MKFEPLQPKKHLRERFDCGVEPLNLYIQKYANQDQKRNLTKVYVLAKGLEIVGYYSISAHSVLKEDASEIIKIGGYKELPFLLLGRLAVDKRHQGEGIGGALIYHAFQTTYHAAEKVGIMGMIVDALDEHAVSFYEGYGFKRLSENRNRLVLPLTAIKRILDET